jgi:hypothetical protein
LVRASSLYLDSRWFDSIQAYQETFLHMIFIPFLLLFLSVFFAIVANRKEVPLFRTLAGVLAIAAIGASIVVFLAMSVN